MRRTTHDAVARFRVNQALLAKIEELARKEHQSPSEFMRDTLNRRVKEAA